MNPTTLTVPTITTSQGFTVPPLQAAFEQLFPTFANVAQDTTEHLPVEESTAVLLQAISECKRILMLYATPESKNAPAHVLFRWIKRVSHVFQNDQGDTVFCGYDVTLQPNEEGAWKETPHAGDADPWRHFRLDRIVDIALAGDAVPYDIVWQGKRWVYPQRHEDRRFNPRAILPANLGRAKADGWLPIPLAKVMVNPDPKPAPVGRPNHENAQLEKARVAAIVKAAAAMKRGDVDLLPSGQPCQGTKTNGDRCQGLTVAGSIFCHAHFAIDRIRAIDALSQMATLNELHPRF